MGSVKTSACSYLDIVNIDLTLVEGVIGMVKMYLFNDSFIGTV